MVRLTEENRLGIHDPVYHHTLRPKYGGFDKWGTSDFRVFTNSLGFRDAFTRDVPLEADRKRIVFIGDSFTEGLGVPYQETFVGKFASAFPDLDVLNAAVESYSPSVYYEKLNYFLGLGLRFDEAVVYIDISDIQDETMYYYDEHGVLQLAGENGAQQLAGNIWSGGKKKAWWESAFYVADFLHQVWLYKKLAWLTEHGSLRDFMQPGYRYSRDLKRASWTYGADASDYGTMGIEGGIQKAKRQMDRLYDVLSRHGIALSVGVYPWPQQLLYDVENSRQVQIWRDWCAGKCKQFFDHFPAFFRFKENDPNFVKDLFIWGDAHFNVRGNQVLADDLIEKYRQR
ncbi:MAG: SGNH/GDSL hydrolase family protein [Methylocella sp.]